MKGEKTYFSVKLRGYIWSYNSLYPGEGRSLVCVALAGRRGADTVLGGCFVFNEVWGLLTGHW